MAKKIGYLCVCAKIKNNHYLFTFQVFILCGGWVGSAVQKVLKMIEFFWTSSLMMNGGV